MTQNLRPSLLHLANIWPPGSDRCAVEGDSWRLAHCFNVHRLVAGGASRCVSTPQGCLAPLVVRDMRVRATAGATSYLLPWPSSGRREDMEKREARALFVGGDEISPAAVEVPQNTKITSAV